MSEKNVLPLPPVYNELANLLFMLQMSYISPMSVDVVYLKGRIDSLIAVIHAHNILENEIKP